MAIFPSPDPLALTAPAVSTRFVVIVCAPVKEDVLSRVRSVTADCKVDEPIDATVLLFAIEIL